MTWLLTPPTPEQVRAHLPRGGLWRAYVPFRPPIFLPLEVRREEGRGVVCVRGAGSLAAVIEDQTGQLRGARWAACTPEGDRV